MVILILYHSHCTTTHTSNRHTQFSNTIQLLTPNSTLPLYPTHQPSLNSPLQYSLPFPFLLHPLCLQYTHTHTYLLPVKAPPLFSTELSQPTLSTQHSRPTQPLNQPLNSPFQYSLFFPFAPSLPSIHTLSPTHFASLGPSTLFNGAIANSLATLIGHYPWFLTYNYLSGNPRPCSTLPYPVLPCSTLPCPTLPCPTLPCPTLPYPTLPCPPSDHSPPPPSTPFHHHHTHHLLCPSPLSYLTQPPPPPPPPHTRASPYSDTNCHHSQQQQRGWSRGYLRSPP